jgi:molecular chaperone DnaK (HSP70)
MFDDVQLAAVKSAAEIGGLQVIGYMSNTQAALLSTQNQADDVLIIDISTTGLVLTLNDNQVIEPILGGDELDTQLQIHCIAEMKRRTGVDISRRPGPVRLLRRECEKAKKALIMTTGDASFELKKLHEGESYAKQLDVDFWFGLVKKRLEGVKKRVMDFIEE